MMDQDTFETLLRVHTEKFVSLLEDAAEVARDGSTAGPESYDREYYIRWMTARYAQFALGVGHEDGDVLPKRDLSDRHVQPCRIPRSEETMELYDLETKRHKAFMECVKAWMAYVNAPDGSTWTLGVPTALYDMLESLETKTGIVAAKAFLEHHGYEVLPALPEGGD